MERAVEKGRGVAVDSIARCNIGRRLSIRVDRLAHRGEQRGEVRASAEVEQGRYTESSIGMIVATLLH